MSILSASAYKQLMESGEETSANSYLLWGSGGTGKSPFAATIAKSPTIRRIFYWDTGGEFNSVVRSKLLTDDELSKIALIRLPDETVRPFGAQAFSSWMMNASRPLFLEDDRAVEHETSESLPPISSLTQEDCIIVDNWSRMVEGINNLIMRRYKMKFDHKGDLPMFAYDLLDDYNEANMMKAYGQQKRNLDGLLGNLLRAKCATIVVAHEWADDTFDTSGGLKNRTKSPTFGKIFPLLGTANYCRENLSRFRNSIYFEINATGKRVLHSVPGSCYNVAGLRNDKQANLAEMRNPTFLDLL